VRTRGFVVDKTSFDQGGQLCWARDWLASESLIVQVPVASLVRGDSPRLEGESKSHAQSMVDAADMPPIIVHRATMQVIDGMHRLTAAILRHQDTIEVRFFDGTAEEAFVIAVAANIAHGLPLSPKDRKAAAARILRMYPTWSDRTIAATAGLSHHTVAAIRRKCPTGQIAQSDSRVGRDGRARPLTADEGRQLAAELIRADQSKSLREIAKEAHVSRSTVQDVRARLQQGGDPLASKTRGMGLDFSIARGRAVLTRLWNNPAVRGNQKGKAMLELLSRSLQVDDEAQSMSRSAPEHCRDAVAEFASTQSDSWSRLARDLRTRTHTG
jgi:ParB-like chromosome segregation protein Spo0J